MSSPLDSSAVDRPVQNRGLARSALLGLLVVAAALRVAHMPSPGEVRDCDELGYLACGPQVWEGIAPSYKSGPTGPETWLQWLYMAGYSAKEFLAGEPHVREAPWQTRVFLAVDVALFRTYEDMGRLRVAQLAFGLAVSLGGVYAAYRLGRETGGMTTAVVLGGLVAVLPLYVEYAAQTRPYIDGWSFGLLAVASAARPRPGRTGWTALWMGLAASSRLDMFGVFPLILWWYWTRRDGRPLGRETIRLLAMTGVVFLVVSPWVMTSLIGNVRLWTTLRVLGQFHTEGGRGQTVIDLVWNQGLGIYLLLVFAGFLLTRGGPVTAGKRAVLGGYVLLLLLSMVAGPSQPFRYHGSPVLAFLTAGAVILPSVFARFPGTAAAIGVAVLAIPFGQSLRTVVTGLADRVPNDLPAWVDEHVPDGTVVYLDPAFETRLPLPTAASAERNWAELHDYRAWQRKFERGTARFTLPGGYVPRALTEENLILDRLNSRRQFLLGGHPNAGRPRFDVRLYNCGQVFYVQDLQAAFRATGGVILWRSLAAAPPTNFGEPVLARRNAAGGGYFIFCSDDLRPRLRGEP